MIPAETSKYYAAIKRGTEWLCLLQKEDGSYGTDVTALEAYYKSPLAFAEAGKMIEGHKVLDWIIENHLTSEGHFHETLVDPSFQRYCDLYQDFWIIWGAYRLGRLDIAQRTLDFTLHFFDRSSGGFQSIITVDPPSAPREVRSTALGGLVNLIAGNIEVAKAAGDFLVEMLDLQPDLSRGFFLVRDASESVVTDFPPEKERFFVVSRNQTRPLYYALGLAVSFLAKLFLMTQESKYLSFTERYFGVCEGYGQDIFQHHYSGKLGWGLAMLYRITRESKYAQLAITVADYLTALQLPTGEWFLHGLFPEPREQPLVLTIDRTAEYIVWLTYIIRELTGESTIGDQASITNRERVSTSKQEYSLAIQSDSGENGLTATYNRFRAVAIDWDGVILDSPPVHLMAWQKALLTVGITVSESEVYLREGGKDSEIAAGIARSKGIRLTRSQINKVCILKRRLFDELFELKPIEGIVDLINDLVATGYRLALVTGTVRETVNRLFQKLSLDTKFEVVVTGDLLRHSKPDPEPYKTAIQQLRLSARDCVAIENAPLGIRSAKRAGLACVSLTTSLPEEFLLEADFVFHSVSALREWFFSQEPRT